MTEGTTTTPILQCHGSGSTLEITDPSLDTWMMRLTPTTEPPSPNARLVTSGVSAVGALAQSLAPVGAILGSTAGAGQALQVVFSPATQAAIRMGTLHLMNSSTGLMPQVVDAAGKIREIGRVVPGAMAVGGAPLLPILLPAAAAAAASYYERKMLQESLDGIREVVDRIEERMRDDDWATLEAADDLTHLLVDADVTWEIPEQLRTELAMARQSVERVFRSRRRFVQQLEAKIDYETKGMSDPWTDAVRKIAKDRHNWIEISIYLQAMVVRARLTSATAFVLATDGDAQASSVLTRNAISELAASYNPLHESLRPLADHHPGDKLFDKVPWGQSGDDERFRYVGKLVENINAGIGSALRAAEEELEIVLPAHEVKALQPGA